MLKRHSGARNLLGKVVLVVFYQMAFRPNTIVGYGSLTASQTTARNHIM